MKQPILSLSKEKGDFRTQAYRGTGKGGQKKNKTFNACRIWHDESGAVSQCEEQRSYEQNRKRAFEKLIASEKFQQWHKIEVARKMGLYKDIDEQVENDMSLNNLKIEIQEEGKWVEIDENNNST